MLSMHGVSRSGTPRRLALACPSEREPHSSRMISVRVATCRSDAARNATSARCLAPDRSTRSPCGDVRENSPNKLIFQVLIEPRTTFVRDDTIQTQHRTVNSCSGATGVSWEAHPCRAVRLWPVGGRDARARPWGVKLVLEKRARTSSWRSSVPCCRGSPQETPT